MKKIFKMAFLAAFVLTIGYSAYSSFRTEATLSDLTLDNVEALAGETSGNWYLLNVTQTSHECLRGGYFDCV